MHADRHTSRWVYTMFWTLTFMYSNSDFILDDFAVTRHNSNKFDSALV